MEDSLNSLSRNNLFQNETPVFASSRVYLNLAEYGDSFLLMQFREFYREVITLSYIVKSSNWIYPEDLNIESNNENSFHEIPNNDAAKITKFVWQRLLTLLENQSIEARRRGGNFGYEFYREAQYVMVALADEIFLNLDWVGKQGWISTLLESKLFQSHIAGELIFQRIEKLLQSSDPIYRDLAAVYLMALSLGFLGKYRSMGDQYKLLNYRQQLFSFIFYRRPNIDSQTRLCTEAYPLIARQEVKQKLPSPRLWVSAVILSIVAYLVTSHFLWTRLVTPIDGIYDGINKEVESLRKNN